MAEHCKIISAALVDGQEERSYVLKINGYSRTKGLVKNGEFLLSAPFSFGGHSWAVRYYPNGIDDDSIDFISLYLHLQTADAQDVNAKFGFSLLDEDGEPVSQFSFISPMHSLFTREDSSWGFYDFIRRVDLEGSVNLRDDCLTIRCDVTVIKEIHNEEASVPPSDLHRHLGNLLENKDAADLIFQVGGRRFCAHRCVLTARSSVFKAELLGAMKESSHNPIKIRDMEADVFKSLLHFIYTDTLPPVPQSNKGIEARADLVMAGHLLVAADRFNMPRLKLICEEKLCNHIDSDMVATSLALAEQHGFHGLKEACLKFLTSPSNLEAMMASDDFDHLKTSCPSVLKELIARILPAEMKAAKDLVMTI